MSRATIISISLIVLGFVFEYLYLTVDSQFWDVKFWISGIACIIIGAIGLWLYTIIPWMENNKKNK